MNLFPEIVLTGFTVAYSALLLFYYSGWRKTNSFSENKITGQTRVSIVVAVRNEAKNIRECLVSLLSQDYPQELYEIIIVDDFSGDATLRILQSYSISNMKVLQLKDFLGESEVSQGGFAFKKKALTVGVENSTGELIITTDGDCSMGEKWLSTIVGFYEKEQPKIIAAPVALFEEKNFLEKWQSLDVLGLLGITAGAITNGFPNMCNGANLAYQKSVFEEVGGFGGVDGIPTGDDIFLLLKIKKRYPDRVKFLKSQDAIVYTRPQETLSALISQRIRWVSKSGDFQNKKITAVLAFTYLFNLFILLSLFTGIFFSSKMLWLALFVFVVKMLAELPLFWEVSGFLKKRKLLLYYIPAQLIHIFYVVFIGVAGKFFSYSWKGRVINPENQIST